VATQHQADRGTRPYAENCAPCHGAALQGQGAFPPLVGDRFNASWEGKSVADLLTRMRRTMPQDEPGSLTPAQVADILAYVLRAGGFPAGQTPLDGDPGALTGVIFVGTLHSSDAH